MIITENVNLQTIKKLSLNIIKYLDSIQSFIYNEDNQGGKNYERRKCLQNNVRSAYQNK